MGNTDNHVYEVEYERWGRVVVKAQLIIALVVFVIELINNALLYVTRSQGYGPDTIVEKLIRYLLITTIFNFSLVILSILVEKFVKDATTRRFLLMLFMVLLCSNVAVSHYQFAVTLACFVIPIVVSILF